DANAEFARPAGRPRKKQVSNVGARNEKHEAHGSKQNQKERADFTDNVLPQGHQSNPGISVHVRKGRGQVGGNVVHIGSCLGETDAVFQAAYGIRAHSRAAVAKGGIVPLANRYEDVGLPIKISAVVTKAAGNDADHGICSTVKVESFS